MAAAPANRSLPVVARRSAGRPNGELVRISPLFDSGQAPAVVRPVAGVVDLAAWASGAAEDLAARLADSGALLFRGFGITDAGSFDRAVRALAGSPLSYEDRSSPRSQVAGNVFTSTDHPAEHEIFLHNEQSYSDDWPSRIAFCCARPAAAGGQTPIADSRVVYRSIDRRIRHRFEQLGVMYVRNLGNGLGLDWRTAYQTDDRSVVEQRCAAAGGQWEWLPGDGLRTRHVRPAVLRHPRSGEHTWFNHATFFHVSTLDQETADVLTAEFAPDALPCNTFYGDGSPIEPEVMEHLRAAYRAATISFHWQRGDLLLLDNMLTAHGRAPYQGERSILVAMAAPLSWTDVEHGGVADGSNRTRSQGDRNMDDLVTRLCDGQHAVKVSRVDSADELMDSIRRRYVLLEVTGTDGGTEIGVAIVTEDAADAESQLDSGAGELLLTGELVLNYVPVRCVVTIDPGTLLGSARFTATVA